MEKGREITAEALKKVLLGETDDWRIIIKIFHQHNVKMESLVGTEYAPGILQRFKTSLDQTKNFICTFYGKEDLAISEFIYQFINEYNSS